jgi:hypothetical protein
MFTLPEIMGIKKAAIVLKTLASGFENESVKAETMTLVTCVMAAAIELEEQYYIANNQEEDVPYDKPRNYCRHCCQNISA